MTPRILPFFCTGRTSTAWALSVLLGVCGSSLAGIVGSQRSADPARGQQVQRPVPSGRPINLTLIDTQLRTESIEFVSIAASEGGPSSFVYLDSQRVRRTKPLRDVAALGPANWSDEAAAPPPAPSLRALSLSALALTDGQRIVGVLGGSDSPGDGLGDDVLIRHERFGALRVPLDKARRFVREASDDDDSHRAAPGPASKGDRVVLRNGDHIEALVDRLGSLIEIAPTAKGAASTKLDADDVRSVEFANPAARASGLRAWLTDGSVVALRALSSESDGGRLRARVGLASQSSVDATYVLPSEIIAIAPEAGSIHALSGLPRSSPLALDERLFTESPKADGRGVMGISDLLLPGPMQVDLDLPAGARGLLAGVELPESCWTWGECELVVTLVGASDKAKSSGRPLARVKLNADQPSSTLRVELPAQAGDRLRLRVEPGTRGGIQDQVLIRRGLIMTGPR